MNRNATARVLLIGIDAAEPALLQRWMRSGDLPNLRRLADAGVATELSTPALQFPDLPFLSAYTSRNPANLGRYFFIQPRTSGAGLRILDERLLRGEPFWVTAARHGRRCIVVDTPKVGVHPPEGGVHVVGWGTHGFTEGLAAYPNGIASEILARHGPYPLAACDDHGRSPRDLGRVLRLLLAGIEMRRALLLDLMRARPWHLFFAVFAETHCAGHQFWHCEDETHPLHGRMANAGLRSALRDVYAAIDRGIGALVEAAGADARVIVFSSHGMRPQYHGRDLLPALLRLWGMHAADNVEPDPTRERRHVVRQPLLKAAREAVPLRVQYRLKRLLPSPLANELLMRFIGTVSLDVTARAFAVPNNEITPALRVNLIGRDPCGRVPRGGAYDALRDFLAIRLRELVNPASGRAALDDVSVVDQIYAGEQRDVLPDVTGYWSPAAPIEALYSPGYGTVIGSHKDYRTGGHAPRGLVVTTLARSVRDGADIKDIAPTVLDLLGVPIPSDMEGRSLAGSDA